MPLRLNIKENLGHVLMEKVVKMNSLLGQPYIGMFLKMQLS